MERENGGGQMYIQYSQRSHRRQVTEWLTYTACCIASPRKPHASKLATTANVRSSNQTTWPQMQGGRVDSSRKRVSHWARALKPHSGGSIRTRSSRASVDSVFIEDFSDSNSGSSRSSRGPRVPSPVSGSETSVSILTPCCRFA